MKKNTWKTVLTVVVLLALAAALVVAAVECANGASLANTAWSLLPPVIAIILALITKEAYSALFIGVLVGGLFTCGFAPVATLDTIVNDGLIAAISGNAGIFLFLVLLGIIGGNMIREALSKDEDKLDGSLAFKTMLLLAIATSIDALAVGITFAFLPDTHIVPAVALIGSITFVFSAAGIRLGNVFGLRYKSKAEFAGGVILILLGTKILLEHLGVL